MKRDFSFRINSLYVVTEKRKISDATTSWVFNNNRLTLCEKNFLKLVQDKLLIFKEKSMVDNLKFHTTLDVW